MAKTLILQHQKEKCMAPFTQWVEDLTALSMCVCFFSFFDIACIFYLRVSFLFFCNSFKSNKRIKFKKCAVLQFKYYRFRNEKRVEMKLNLIGLTSEQVQTASCYQSNTFIHGYRTIFSWGKLHLNMAIY